MRRAINWLGPFRPRGASRDPTFGCALEAGETSARADSEPTFTGPETTSSIDVQIDIPACGLGNSFSDADTQVVLEALCASFRGRRARRRYRRRLHPSSEADVDANHQPRARRRGIHRCRPPDDHRHPVEDLYLLHVVVWTTHYHHPPRLFLALSGVSSTPASMPKLAPSAHSYFYSLSTAPTCLAIFFKAARCRHLGRRFFSKK